MPAPHDKTKDLLEITFGYGLDIQNRRVFIHEEINTQVISAAIRSLLFLDKSAGDIELWLSSPGGDKGEMFALYDIIRSLTNKITTIGFGEVCSATCLLLVSGDKRLVTENCWFMWHGEQINMEDEGLTVEAQMRAVARQRKKWLFLMAKHTKRTEAWWLKQMVEKRELWLDAEQMISDAYGIADGIYGAT